VVEVVEANVLRSLQSKVSGVAGRFFEPPQQEVAALGNYLMTKQVQTSWME
jgi:hypothetical protein